MIPKYKFACLLITALPLFCFAQENSPYSRYGIGNLIPAGNILNRGMGGISAGHTDPATINSVNPATYGNLLWTTLDVGVEYDGRNLKSNTPPGSYKSNNGIISYLQLGFPLLNGNKKAEKKNTSWSLAFGLKPLTKINYKIDNTSRNSIDSVEILYEGNGGVNEAFIGTALRLKNFTIGVNSGYLFGEKDYNTKLIFINDTVNYYKSNYDTKARFGGVFLDAGFQYAIKIKGGSIRLGGYGNLQRKYNATKDELKQTFTYNSTSGNPDMVDSVYANAGQKGQVQLPATVGGGFTIEKEHILIGADFETTNWNSYRFFGQKDLVQNSWLTKFGIQYLPVSSSAKSSYFSYVKYRAGFSFGRDYIAVDNNLPVYTVSVGASFPLKLKHNFYDYQYSIMNIALEYGNRGNNSNNITENIFRVSLGFSLSDLNWFRRQKYQ